MGMQPMRHSNYFGTDEQIAYNNAMAMLTGLKDTRFEGRPVPLLHSQLGEAIVFADRFSRHARALRDMLEKG